MKKARIMLSAIALVTVVGGALAFKANKFGTLTVFTRVGTTCPADPGLYQPGSDIQFNAATTDAASAASNICNSQIQVAAE